MSIENINETATESAVGFKAGMALADALQDPFYIEGVPHMIVNGELICLEKFLAKPKAVASRLVALSDVDSFIAYVNRYKQPDLSLIFASLDAGGGNFTARLDFPGPGEEQNTWNKHVAKLILKSTPEWLDWHRINGKWQTQDEFITFIERYEHRFLSPNGAHMAEIATSLEGKRSGQFKFGAKLATGDRSIIFHEETALTAGGEKLTVPPKVIVALQPFIGSPTQQFTAFLRVRVAEGKVSFQLELHQVEAAMEVMLEEITQVVANETAVPILNGQV